MVGAIKSQAPLQYENQSAIMAHISRLPNAVLVKVDWPSECWLSLYSNLHCIVLRPLLTRGTYSRNCGYWRNLAAVIRSCMEGITTHLYATINFKSVQCMSEVIRDVLVHVPKLRRYWQFNESTLISRSL